MARLFDELGKKDDRCLEVDLLRSGSETTGNYGLSQKMEING